MRILQSDTSVAERKNTGSTSRAQSRLIMVSNRGPVEHNVDEQGRVRRRANGGGVATALSSLDAGLPITWIANGTSATDCALASGRTIDLDETRRLRLVAPPAESYDLFYNVFCNPLLWFLQHGLTDRLGRFESPRTTVNAWERGYLPVNQAFAEAVVSEIDREAGAARVMLHDYHLYAAPLFIRNMRPNAQLQHFIHIPWPAPSAWDLVPRSIVQSICEGLLANDSVVFQTPAFAENFLRTVRAVLPEARTPAPDLVIHGARRTRVWANPVSVDIWDLRSRLATDEADTYRQRLAAEGGERTIVRVDRLDPSKNVAAGFRAFGRLLETHPEWKGHVRFLTFLVPSRTSIPEYRTYADEVFAEIEKVNRSFGTSDWTPIEVYHEHNREQALVGLSMYDVLLVNSVVDGMNLVSKEGPVVNDRDGVLVLSRTAGSYGELREGALGIEADDFDGTAAALHRALSMTLDERAIRARALRAAVLRHSLRRWLRLLLDDLEAQPPYDAPLASASGQSSGLRA